MRGQRRLGGRFWAVVVSSGMALALAGCGGGEATSAGGGAAPSGSSAGGTAEITVSIPGQNVSTVPLDFATKQGIFSANGIASVKTITADAQITLPALKTGSIQVATLATGNLLQGREQGLDLVYICGVYPFLPNVMLTNDKSLKDLKEAGDWQGVLKQLQGKLVGVPSLGTNNDLALREALKQVGLQPDTDVKIVAIPTNAAVGALKSGQVNVTFAPPFVNSQIVANGGKQLMLAKDIPAAAGFNGGWAAMRSWVEQNRTTAAGFCNSYSQALQAVGNPANADAVKTILKDGYKLEDASLPGALESLTTFLSVDIPKDSLELSFNTVVKRGQAKQTVPYDVAVLKP